MTIKCPKCEVDAELKYYIRREDNYNEVYIKCDCGYYELIDCTQSKNLKAD